MIESVVRFAGYVYEKNANIVTDSAGFEAISGKIAEIQNRSIDKTVIDSEIKSKLKNYKGVAPGTSASFFSYDKGGPTMMRYLQADMLKDCGINHFDEWAADFGEVKTDYEHISLCSKIICVHSFLGAASAYLGGIVRIGIAADKSRLNIQLCKCQ